MWYKFWCNYYYRVDVGTMNEIQKVSSLGYPLLFGDSGVVFLLLYK
jgi:hypothetical protein